MRWPPPPSDFAVAVGSLVRKVFQHDGFLDPVAFLFATRNPLTGERSPPTLLSFPLVGTPSRFAMQLRAIARDLGACMIVQAYEIRMVGELRDQALRGWERLGEDPDAKEYVALFVEDLRAPTPLALLAPVELRGIRVVGRFDPIPVHRVEGWLTAILPVLH